MSIKGPAKLPSRMLHVLFTHVTFSLIHPSICQGDNYNIFLRQTGITSNITIYLEF